MTLTLCREVWDAFLVLDEKALQISRLIVRLVDDPLKVVASEVANLSTIPTVVKPIFTEAD